jgi:hypothetical protein
VTVTSAERLRRENARFIFIQHHDEEGRIRRWRVMMDDEMQHYYKHQKIYAGKDGTFTGLRVGDYNKSSSLSLLSQWRKSGFMLTLKENGDMDRLLKGAMKELGIDNFTWAWAE